MRLAPEGRFIVLPLLILTALAVWQYDSLGLSLVIPWVFVGLLVFCINFFRDPIRTVPAGENFIIAPADGKIVKITDVNDTDVGEAQLVSIFLNVFNVHCNRMPIDGTFTSVKYEKGKFLAAFDHKASDENERTEITISSKIGPVKVKQIAGLIARRILCYAKNGKSMEMGGRLGFIRFGSRTDLILPKHVNLSVELGQKVVGNKTIMGTYE
ncbi:MAG: phosphatidylserine decarboxylase family protein [Candidatus Marinimicrobia bacterium]|jgi:phosphatidylserine decarboxylase|nr:phosphatidylserine decarboxylase family protein [Candidatus Neomarinimicrobiota bacterium]MBT3946292.1 phosphatidylserine decarboxylase family protein [Candidatus Neomarinimicrobiota bacterium]MBT4154717.1 phosphatidylserine decarboxylase family protein [Candidatus Neomarinimicrobiota bacterium]MBT4555676.1 phosphatidylserine decarboxylase family protein [Candidatus Neomarinimicrobiota bacterium]MBT4753608.1 phosphatidylserine decarboxylase family protein [Candidatus Neomarinimicrobiota bact|tara:strand:+ start:22013 stop:22648 length:636 start_codon:yes stop_codon:yes gene_type:complete